jgi:phenylacetate-CoA ligase
MNWRKHAFLLGHDAIGSKLRGHYREFLELEEWTPAQLEEVHQARLTRLLQHAVKEVPFYRERVRVPQLGSFPVLRKEAVHSHFEELMESSLLAEFRAPKRRRGYSWVEVKTGGSTGTPTVVIHDRDFRDWGRAGRLYSQYLCGFPLGTPFFMLWGSMRDINEARDSAQKRVLNALLGVRPMNAFLMDEERMAGYARRINQSKVEHLMAYVDAAEQLARFIEKSGTPVRRLESVMACAGTVTEEARSTLGRVFGARIHNKYGSRECADIACECLAGGFHIYDSGVHLEIVDENDRPVPAGATGRLLVTLLHNARFPIIRYEIGDVGVFKEGLCGCGSPLPLLARVEGRITEQISTASGAYIGPTYIRHLVGVVHNPGALTRFQFTQTGAAEYALELQFDPSFGGDAFARLAPELERDLKRVLGEDARLAIERVADIPPSASGKFLYVRNLHRAKT